MSLRDLKDEIYLILQIKEGYSFGFATCPLVITANLAGNIHESFIVEPSPQPKFENEFVWVMDKTKMKNIWAEKLPVRIECFSVNQAHRTRIGYIILNVKDAQIAQDEAKITEKQLRLLGLTREAALLKPELILSFYITDVPIQTPQLVPQFSPRLEGPRVEVTSGPVKVTLGSGRDHFNLSISVANTHNLDHLLPPQLELDLSKVRYCYSLLDRELVSSGGVRVALVSNVTCLKTYLLRNPTAAVAVTAGDVTLGQTTISLEGLAVWEDSTTRRPKSVPRTVDCRCVLSPDTEAWVEFSVTLAMEVPVPKKKLPVPALSAVGAGGDADSTRLTLPLKAPVTPRLTANSLPSLHDGEQQQPRGSKSGGETYRTQQPSSSHVVVVTVTSLHLDDTPSLPHGQMWLRLSQPSATVSPSGPVPLPQPWSPLQYQLCVTLPSHLVHSTLASQPPGLQLGTGDAVLATATLPSTLADCTIQVELKGEDGERVGEVGLSWGTNHSSPRDLTSQSAPTLTDTSLSPPTCSRSKTVGAEVLSPRSRELKMLSFVEELEDWAEKQRLIVMEGLKEEEAARLASLQAQWEAEVGGQVSEGRQLLQALHSMRDDLRLQEDQLRENQYKVCRYLKRRRKLKVYKEELERVHRSKLQEFKDLSRRMQDEFNHKLALIASDKAALEREVEQLRAENLEMKQKWREVEQKSTTDKRAIDSLTHEMSVLKEKLNMEAESKRFFKEHCRKAEQEIHRLNCLRQQELEARLLSDKKSLEHLAFQQIIVEKNDLRQDQELLNEIRQQLLRAPTANSGSNVGTFYSERTSDDRHIRRAT